MRRVSSFVLVCLSLVTLGSVASAAPPREKPREQFIDMGEMLINGTIGRPSVQAHNIRKIAQFERMLNLRKDMTPGIFKASKDPVFK